VLRAATTVLFSVFVLPSCFTFSVWREGNKGRGPAFAAAAANAADAPQLRLLCRCGPLLDIHYPQYPTPRERPEQSLERVRALWQPPLAVGTWLEIEPMEHADVAARLWRDLPADCGVQILPGDAGEGPRCWFVCPASLQYHKGGLPDGFDNWPGVHTCATEFGARALVFEAECRIRPASAPAGATTETIAVQPCNPPAGTGTRLLLTPLTLALDTVLLPFELIGLPVWF
jgi:hypothetical protein